MRAPISGAVVRGSGLGVNLGIQVLLAAQLPAGEYAVVAVGISLATVWAVISALGLDTVASREIGGRHGDAGFAGSWWRQATRALVLRAPLGAGGFLLTGSALSLLGGAYGDPVLLWLGLSVPGLALLRLTEGVARGAHRTVHASAWLNTVAPLMWGLIVVVVVVSGADLTVAQVIWARVASALVVAAVAQVVLLRSLHRHARDHPATPEPVGRVSTSWGLLLLAVVATSTSQLDTLLAGMVLSSDAAGSYALTARLASGVSIVLFGVNLIAAPRIAAGHRHDDMPVVAEELRAILRRAVPVAAALSVLIAVGTVAVVEQLREGYVASWSTIGLLLLGQIVSVAYGPVGTALTMTSDEWSAVRARVASIVLQVVVSLGLGALTGQVGVAAGTLAGLTTWNAVMSKRATERLGVTLRWGAR